MQGPQEFDRRHLVFGSTSCWMRARTCPHGSPVKTIPIGTSFTHTLTYVGTSGVKITPSPNGFHLTSGRLQNGSNTVTVETPMPRQYVPTQSICTVEIDHNQLHSPACHRLKTGSHVRFVVVGKVA